MKREEAESKTDTILHGIDCCEVNVEEGWWETSTGEEFGSAKLKEMQKLVKEIYDDFESRNCTNCRWIKDEVCVNDNSRLVADFVTKDDVCKNWEARDVE